MGNSISSKSVTLKEAFNICPGEVISLVGAGGKTTLMSALAKELGNEKARIISTTTTKIFEWQACGDILVIEKDGSKILDELPRILAEYQHISLASEKLPIEGKLKGISPETIVNIAKSKQADYIIIEADGAGMKLIKAPNATEPVIPQNTTLVIAIIGIDALGVILNKENVFRPEIVTRLTGLPIGEVITAETIATLVTHSEGITKGSPPDARIIPVINKMDLIKDIGEAKNIAQKILELDSQRINSVVLCQLQSAKPLVDTVTGLKK
ncbi:MAG: putative selenium-dependent hydroxylase accessory protein YqeC [Dehalococcoidia bacterium]|nr:MAG: putative selenium-dependent hydroxylase accessory protein YqeC [Dehalococcoidia bacterium]